MKKSLVLLCTLLLLCLCGCSDTELGMEEAYTTVTLQIDRNLFYDVRVPSNAVLESTDGATFYDYDIINIGVMNNEPRTGICTQVTEGKWVFAYSPDKWYTPTRAGFEIELPYEGFYDLTYVNYLDGSLDVEPHNDAYLEKLINGQSITLGGSQFTTVEHCFATWDEALDAAYLKMSTLYHQDLTSVYRYGKALWVHNNNYAVIVVPVNYNTNTIITASGPEGINYAALYLRGLIHEA